MNIKNKMKMLSGSLSTKQKLFYSFLFTIGLLSVPYLFLLPYLQAIQTGSHLPFLIAVFLACTCSAFLFAYHSIIQPVSNISSAAAKIFEDYIESSLLTADNSAPEKNLYSADHTVQLMHHVEHLMNKEYTAEMLRKQAELDALQSQINPHFLYNTLESIRGQAVCEGVETIAEMAKALSDFFRYSIQSKKPLVQLSEELHIVDSYIKIQNYRFNNKYKIDLRLDEDSLLEVQLPRLTLQPLVENALLHGLRNSVKTAEVVKIHAYQTQKRLVISVQDHGEGIPDAVLTRMNESLRQPLETNLLGAGSPKSIGLNNINERIKLHYGDEYGLKLFSAQNYGTAVEISLPISQTVN